MVNRLGPTAAEHEVVSFGIDAHGEVGWLAVFGLGFLGTLSAGTSDGLGPRYDIGDLEGQAGPSALAFASPVDGDESSSDFHLGDVRVLAKAALGNWLVP